MGPSTPSMRVGYGGFPACVDSSLGVIVPMDRPSMAICPRTGITIPECSCNACLEAQIRRHRPGHGDPEIRIARSPGSTTARPDQRRAA